MAAEGYKKVPARVEYRDREKPSVAVWVKAIMMSLATVYPFYAVVDELTHVKSKDFVPCNDQACRYIKLFGAGRIPGTGADVIQIQNGMSRPIYMHDYKLQILTATYYKWKNNHSVQAFAHEHSTGGVHAHDDDAPWHHAGHALSTIDDTLLHEEIDRETTRSSFTLAYKFSFWTQKTLLRLFIGPFAYVSHLLYPETFGKHRVVPAICPGLNVTQMRQKCHEPEVRKLIDDGSLKGGSRTWIYIGLFGWSIAKSLHDILVVKCVDEQYTIMVGQVSTIFQAVAVFSVFLWSTGGFGVFGAMVPNTVSDCMCYYRMPLLGAVASLATPTVMLVYFFSKVQAVGMSILYGDYLYFATYDVPAYLVRQSKMWSWSTLVGPWLAGTPVYEQGTSATLMNRKQCRVKPRTLTAGANKEDELKAYRRLSNSQNVLILSRFAVWLMPVCLASAAAYFRSKELLITFMNSGLSESMNLLLRFSMLVPMLFASVYPLKYVLALYNEILPEWIRVHGQRNRWYIKLLRCNNQLSEEALFRLLIIVIGSFELTLSAALALGLWPGISILHTTPEWPTISEAELDGASGFVLIALPLQQLFLEVFVCREDQLKYEFACGERPNSILPWSAASDAKNDDSSIQENSFGAAHVDADAILADESEDYDGFGLRINGKGNTDFAPDARRLFEDLRALS